MKLRKTFSADEIGYSSSAAALRPGISSADWRDFVGFPQLQADLGAALPTGAGIPVMMSEASLPTVTLLDFSPTYLPQATTGTLPFSSTPITLALSELDPLKTYLVEKAPTSPLAAPNQPTHR